MPAAATEARLGWYPHCSHSSPNGALTWACPLHDPLLQADCAGCSEREQRRAGELLEAREIRRARERKQLEAMTMARKIGFWKQEIEHDGKTLTRLEIARLLIAEGKSKAEVERTLGASPNTLCEVLKADERKRKPPQEPKAEPTQGPTQPADEPTVRDPVEVRLPVQETQREYGRPALTVPSTVGEYAPAAEGGADTVMGLEGGDDTVLEATEQTACGILQAFVESDAAEVMALVFEFLEYKGLEAECELFIRFGLWRSKRQAG